MTETSLTFRINRFARLSGRAAPAAQVLAAAQSALPHVQILTRPSTAADYDYTQIDLALNTPTDTVHPLIPPVTGVGYAGLTPNQRAHFRQWLADPLQPAPPAFQQLYLAYLEVALLEGGEEAKLASQELQRLSEAPAWHHHEGLARAAILMAWVNQSGATVARWIGAGVMPVSVLGVAVGCQALLGEPLQVDELAVLLESWQITDRAPRASLLSLRLRSLTTNLGDEPLVYVLRQVEATTLTPQLWRANHRDLRLALPQVDLHALLEPVLAEIMVIPADSEPPASMVTTPASNDATLEDLGWRLVLEFGHSRSDLFQFALSVARRLPSFTQLLDEDRKIVYRVIFKKGEMRNFWRLWEYVQSWSNTRVYLNGQELQKWQVFPYSHYLR